MSVHSRTLVLVNPQARNGQLGREWPSREKEVLEALGESSIPVVFTTQEEHGSSLVRKALQEGADRIVVVGGDGTVSEAVQGFFNGDDIINPQATLMVLPAGRGDDFFKDLTNYRYYRGNSGWSRGLKLLKEGKPRSVDVGRVNWIGQGRKRQRYFINIASFGFPGLVVQRVQERYGVLGKTFLGKSGFAYLMQGLVAFVNYKPMSVQIKVDDHDFYRGKVHSGFVLNGKYNAGGICWDSDARVDDGVFQLMIMEPRDRLNYIKDSAKILLGSWNGIPGIQRARGKKIEVLMAKGQPKADHFFEIDGDLADEGEIQGASIETLSGAIRFHC